MFDFKDEAVSALTLRSSPPTSELEDPQLWAFKRLNASLSDGVIHVQFTASSLNGDEMRRELRGDFTNLADWVANNSRVLLDFEGVSDFDASCIEALTLLEQRLKSKGSRLALCSLGEAAQSEFFPNRISR